VDDMINVIAVSVEYNHTAIDRCHILTDIEERDEIQDTHVKIHQGFVGDFHVDLSNRQQHDLNIRTLPFVIIESQMYVVILSVLNMYIVESTCIISFIELFN
jgi:hypothetical protein